MATRVLRWAAATGVTAVLIALTVTVAVQAGQIDQLRDDLAGAQRTAQDTADGTDQRLDSLDGRLAAVEDDNQQAFDPPAVAAAVLPSVFQVIADDFSGSAFAVTMSGDSTSAGTGRTNVLTAFHVVEAVWTAGDRSVQLERDGKRYTAVITDVDQSRDIALLKVDTGFAGLPAAADPPGAGESVLVVGAPLGLTQTITTGVVSAVRDRTDGPGSVIQFDAPVNPGNSGGPVINTRKEVVGIANAKARDAEGIGLAVPIQTACETFHVC
ncbi:trypsin-like peptidase domain-containing protein [Solwaraspora sp. WMMD792]|uniref:S1C family serine protease n=1 Tax=Solwaraspora sp. WMMD792 TaxID=3016099 RepID=UPI0024161180|nr:trypsin-like peptidase domain-containing protein [Solwaraspora sp. WMMD792]MDG4771809.1 trypsin-like peptidase domain-containing protein [Solwaraspora sp. WMMD792]